MSELYIHNVHILTPSERISHGVLTVQDGKITSIGTTEKTKLTSIMQKIDGEGGFLAPGLIDLQVNGAFGEDFTDNPTTIWKVAEQLPRYGVTSFLPTIITAPLDKYILAQEVLKGSALKKNSGAIPLGLHFEGPFLNPAKKGAHNSNYIRPPTLKDIENWSREQGVWLVTLAPEIPGAIEVIEELSRRGVIVSAGHSTATYEQATMGFWAGIRYGTHLFNAQSTLQHREPGLPGALMSDDNVFVGFIPDGLHLHSAIVKLIWKAIGKTRLVAVTDCMAALGKPAGKYLLADLEVIVDTTSARLADGTIAGSILALDQGVRNLIQFTGCTLEEALATVTSTPATMMDLPNKGHLKVGADADLVIFRGNLQVSKTIVNGNVVFESE